MLGRVVLWTAFALTALIILWRHEHRAQPLVIDAKAEQPPSSIPDPNALFVPCPLTPRNVPTIQKRLA